MKRLLLAICALAMLVSAPISLASAGRSYASARQQDKQEQTVYITNTGKKYHRDGCRFLSKSKIAIKRKDAEAKGYEPCRVCKP